MASGDLIGWSALGLAVVAGLLLVVQTLRLGRIERQFRALTRGAGAGTASMSLGDLVSAQGARLEATREEMETLRRALTSLDASVTRSVQYVGLVRYNPFEETGGDQSFALALLDKRGDGVVVNSLHSRTNTRFYAKPIKGGTSQLALSDEEAKAVQQAMRTSDQ